MYCRIELKVREGADALLSHEADLPVFTEDNTALSSTEFPSPSRRGDNGECRGALWNSLYTSLSRGRAYSLRRLMHIPKGSPQCRLDPLACFDPSGAREKGEVGSRAHPFVLRGGGVHREGATLDTGLLRARSAPVVHQSEAPLSSGERWIPSPVVAGWAADRSTG
jgi:hypothetical protein